MVWKKVAINDGDERKFKYVFVQLPLISYQLVAVNIPETFKDFLDILYDRI